MRNRILAAMIVLSTAASAHAQVEALFVAEDGDIGIGTSTPAAGVRLHLVTADPNVALLQSTESVHDVAFILIQNGGSSDLNSTGIGSFREALLLRAGDATRLTVNADGSISSSTGARLSSGGAWLNASSRALKEEIHQLTLQAASSALEELRPVTFRYRDDQDEQQVGFIAEEVPELVATKDRTSLGTMEILAVLTRVVQQQQEQIQDLVIQLEALKTTQEPRTAGSERR